MVLRSHTTGHHNLLEIPYYLHFISLKLKSAVLVSRRLHFGWFNNRSRDLDEIYRSRASIRFDHISRFWYQTLTKSTKLKSWESGESNFEDENFWGFVYLKIQRLSPVPPTNWWGSRAVNGTLFSNNVLLHTKTVFLCAKLCAHKKNVAPAKTCVHTKKM